MVIRVDISNMQKSCFKPEKKIVQNLLFLRYMRNKIKQIIGFFLFCTPVFSGIMAHPYYLSLTEIEINSTEKEIKISCRMFTDDLENALKKLYEPGFDLKKTKDGEQAKQLIQPYILQHFSLWLGGEEIVPELIGYEFEDESTWCYLQAFYSSQNDKVVKISSTLLYDFIEKQTNMVHIIRDGNRQSTKLTYPDKVWEVFF